jgi:Transcriptional regulatory protein, C terminal
VPSDRCNDFSSRADPMSRVRRMRPQALICFATLPPLQPSWSFIVPRQRGVSSRQRCVDRCAGRRGTPSLFDDWNVDFRNMQLRREGSSFAPLTPQEFKISNSTEQDAERVISRDELLNEVRGCHKSDSRRSVDHYILRLRQKL